MENMPAWIKKARAHWKYRGEGRPPFASPVAEGQESVWDYPRPPRVEKDSRHILVRLNQQTIAETHSAYRILETASPPTFYLPRNDIQMEHLQSVSSSSFCEWKGQATYWTVIHGGQSMRNAGWSYEDPFPGFEAIAGYIAFYAWQLECFVDGGRAMPQPGHLYGGWVTPEVVGPFKGETGSEGW